MLKKVILLVIITPIILPAVVWLLMITAVLWLNAPFTSGVVMHKTLQNGVDVCIVQYFKGLAEPYQVSLYARYPKGNWRWFYLEHEAERWRNTSIDLQRNDIALIYERGKLEATVSLDRDSVEDREARYFPGYLSCEELNQAHKSRSHGLYNLESIDNRKHHD